MKNEVLSDAVRQYWAQNREKILSAQQRAKDEFFELSTTRLVITLQRLRKRAHRSDDPELHEEVERLEKFLRETEPRAEEFLRDVPPRFRRFTEKLPKQSKSR